MTQVGQPALACRPRPRSRSRRTRLSRRGPPETPFIGGPSRTQVDAWDPAQTAPAGYEACVRTLQDFRRVLLDAAQGNAGVTEVLFATENLEWTLDASRAWGADRLEGVRRRVEAARCDLAAYVARETEALPVMVRLRLLARTHFLRECSLYLHAEVELAA
ncbi:MAG: hypothetical protein R3F39_19330 [Myxococcota bacterium]